MNLGAATGQGLYFALGHFAAANHQAFFILEVEEDRIKFQINPLQVNVYLNSVLYLYGLKTPYANEIGNNLHCLFNGHIGQSGQFLFGFSNKFVGDSPCIINTTAPDN